MVSKYVLPYYDLWEHCYSNPASIARIKCFSLILRVCSSHIPGSARIILLSKSLKTERDERFFTCICVMPVFRLFPMRSRDTFAGHSKHYVDAIAVVTGCTDGIGKEYALQVTAQIKTHIAEAARYFWYWWFLTSVPVSGYFGHAKPYRNRNNCTGNIVVRCFAVGRIVYKVTYYM